MVTSTKSQSNPLSKTRDGRKLADAAPFEKMVTFLNLAILNFMEIAQKENPESSFISAQIVKIITGTLQLMTRTPSSHISFV
jgi:hypothetical protein